MMEDDGVERALRRYRVTGPPSDLRDRVLQNGPGSHQPWLRRPATWTLAAAASLLLFAAVLQVVTARIDHRMAAAEGKTEMNVEDIASLLEASGADVEALSRDLLIYSALQASGQPGAGGVEPEELTP